MPHANLGAIRAALRLALACLLALPLMLPDQAQAAGRRQAKPIETGWNQVDVQVRGFGTSEALLAWISSYPPRLNLPGCQRPCTP